MDEEDILEETDNTEEEDTDVVESEDPGTVEASRLADDEQEYFEYALDKDGHVKDYKVYGLEAVKVWITLVLQIARERFELFTSDYGNEVENLIGTTNRDLFVSESERMIRECLTQNKYIQGIRNFYCEFEMDKAVCAFTVVTVFGEEDLDNVEI